jgi:UV excision repair protein RAD23
VSTILQITVDLATLRDSPQFQQLREVMLQNPALIQPLVHNIAASNPAIAQMITQNPDPLFRLLDVEGNDLEDENGEHLPPSTYTVNIMTINQVSVFSTFALLNQPRID